MGKKKNREKNQEDLAEAVETLQAALKSASNPQVLEKVSQGLSLAYVGITKLQSAVLLWQEAVGEMKKDLKKAKDAG